MIELIILKLKDITDTVNGVCMVTVATLPNGLQLRLCCVPHGRLLFVRDIAITSALDCMSCTNQSSTSHNVETDINDVCVFSYQTIHIHIVCSTYILSISKLHYNLGTYINHNPRC